MTVEKLAENVSGVMHNLKSAFMAVNGYIDLLGENRADKLHDQAKRSTGAIEIIINNLAFAMRTYRNTEPAELSLNACVQSVVELLRSNRMFNGKVKFELEFGEDDGIYAIPSEVMGRLDAFISERATHVLLDGEYVLKVATACGEEHVSVRIDDDEITFPKADL